MYIGNKVATRGKKFPLKTFFIGDWGKPQQAHADQAESMGPHDMLAKRHNRPYTDFSSKKGGRLHIMAKAKEVKFRLQEDELYKAKLIANHFGITINALAKHLVLNLKEPEVKIKKDPIKRTEDKKISQQVGAIGNNINQLARKMNSNPEYLLSKEEMLHELRMLRNETRQLAGKSILSKEEFEESYKVNKKTVIVKKEKSHFFI